MVMVWVRGCRWMESNHLWCSSYQPETCLLEQADQHCQPEGNLNKMSAFRWLFPNLDHKWPTEVDPIRMMSWTDNELNTIALATVCIFWGTVPLESKAPWSYGFIISSTVTWISLASEGRILLKWFGVVPRRQNLVNMVPAIKIGVQYWDVALIHCAAAAADGSRIETTILSGARTLIRK